MHSDLQESPNAEGPSTLFASATTPRSASEGSPAARVYRNLPPPLGTAAR